MISQLEGECCPPLLVIGNLFVSTVCVVHKLDIVNLGSAYTTGYSL